MNLRLPQDWLAPGWAAPPGVHAACSARAGGVSAGAYASLNLGEHVGDAPQAVAENRARFSSVLQARPVFLEQVHGTDVIALDGATRQGERADACWTRERGVACTVMVADCLPVLLADAEGSCVAAAHAGWRGLAGSGGSGVLEALWSHWWPLLAPSPQAAAQRTLAWLGPAIGPRAFEVGDEVRAAFLQDDHAAAGRFQPHAGGKWMADLPGLARDRLRRLGVVSIGGNDSSPPWCTVGNPSRFFSHRRDRVSGRFAASVWLA